MPPLRPILFHALPLVPLALGRYYAALAVLLVIGLAYIKDKRLKFEIAEAQAKLDDRGLRDARLEKQLERLKVSRRRWRAVTFLPWWEARQGGDALPPPPPDTP